MKILNKDYFTSRLEYGGPLEVKVIMKYDDKEKILIGNIYCKDIDEDHITLYSPNGEKHLLRFDDARYDIIKIIDMTCGIDMLFEQDREHTLLHQCSDYLTYSLFIHLIHEIKNKYTEKITAIRELFADKEFRTVFCPGEDNDYPVLYGPMKTLANFESDSFTECIDAFHNLQKFEGTTVRYSLTEIWGDSLVIRIKYRNIMCDVYVHTDTNYKSISRFSFYDMENEDDSTITSHVMYNYAMGHCKIEREVSEYTSWDTIARSVRSALYQIYNDMEDDRI